jgi:hypothetical protein
MSKLQEKFKNHPDPVVDVVFNQSQLPKFMIR